MEYRGGKTKEQYGSIKEQHLGEAYNLGIDLLIAWKSHGVLGACVQYGFRATCPMRDVIDILYLNLLITFVTWTRNFWQPHPCQHNTEHGCGQTCE